MKNHREWMGKDEEGNKKIKERNWPEHKGNNENHLLAHSQSVLSTLTNEWVQKRKNDEREKNGNNFFILDKSGLLYTFFFNFNPLLPSFVNRLINCHLSIWFKSFKARVQKFIYIWQLTALFHIFPFAFCDVCSVFRIKSHWLKYC